MTPETTMIMKLLFSITKEKYYGAIKVSTEHHEDGAGRTRRNFLDFKLTIRACALCRLFGFPECNKHKLCPLFEHENNLSCNIAYREATDAQENDRYFAFHAAECAQVALLESLPPYDEWMATHVRELRGQEIELEYTPYTALSLKIPKDGKGVFRFTGEYQEGSNKCFYYHQDKIAFYGMLGADFKAPILEFVRMVGEPDMNRMPKWFIDTEPDQCIFCAHDYEPAKAEKQAKQSEFKVGDIVRTHYADDSPNGLRKISKIDEHLARFTNGLSAIFSHITLATPAEALQWYEDNYTVEYGDGVKIRVYEDKDGDPRLFINTTTDCWFVWQVSRICAEQVLKALGLKIIPYRQCRGCGVSNTQG